MLSVFGAVPVSLLLNYKKNYLYKICKTCRLHFIMFKATHICSKNINIHGHNNIKTRVVSDKEGEGLQKGFNSVCNILCLKLGVECSSYYALFFVGFFWGV
jgi:hypothetical protein